MNQSSFQKIWISNPTRHGNRYAWRVAGKTVGTVVLAMALLAEMVFLAFWLHWPMGTVSLVVCLGITALAIWMALRIGRQASRDTLIFCQDREDRLFVIDARKFVPYERGILGFFSMAAHTQKILRNLTQSGVLERYLAVPPRRRGQGLLPPHSGIGRRSRPAPGAGVPAGSRASGRTPEKSSAGPDSGKRAFPGRTGGPVRLEPPGSGPIAGYPLFPLPGAGYGCPVDFPLFYH